MDVGKAAGLVLAAAVFSLAAPATAQRVEPSTDSDRAAAADAAAVQAYVAARQQADASAPEATPVETVSGAVQQVTHWIELSGDNNGLPFIVVDKLGAEVFVFDAQGQPLGKAPALLGISLGNDSVPGVGERELRKIPVADRTTPAGRFVAKFGTRRWPPRVVGRLRNSRLAPPGHHFQSERAPDAADQITHP